MEEQNKIITGVIAFIVMVIFAFVGANIMSEMKSTQYNTVLTTNQTITIASNTGIAGCTDLYSVTYFGNNTHTYTIGTQVNYSNNGVIVTSPIQDMNYNISFYCYDYPAEYNITRGGQTGITSYSNMFPTIAIVFISMILVAIVLGGFYFIYRQ